MSASVVCRRCGQKREALTRAPYPGELGQQVQRHVCVDCWNEWREMEVKIINELRLNFIDPESQETLARHLSEFLQLPTAANDDPTDSGDER